MRRALETKHGGPGRHLGGAGAGRRRASAGAAGSDPLRRYGRERDVIS